MSQLYRFITSKLNNGLIVTKYILSLYYILPGQIIAQLFPISRPHTFTFIQFLWPTFTVLETGTNHRHLIEVDYSLSHFKSAKLKDKMHQVFKQQCTKFCFYHLLAGGKLLIHDVVSPSIRYLCY